MRSGTQSRLTLVDRNGQEISSQLNDETAAEYVVASVEEELAPNPRQSETQRSRHNQLLVFALVSAGCAMAAVATGSYALWLSRHRIADEALTSVHDILKTCQDRVTRMEEELSHQQGFSSSTNSPA